MISTFEMLVEMHDYVRLLSSCDCRSCVLRRCHVLYEIARIEEW